MLWIVESPTNRSRQNLIYPHRFSAKWSDMKCKCMFIFAKQFVRQWSTQQHQLCPNIDSIILDNIFYRSDG